MRLPNLFIIGAPRAGTTALYSYLSEHPDIFFPTEKEPNFHTRELGTHWRIRTNEEYCALFREAGDCNVVGEASALYCGTTDAAKNIRAFNPEARIIMMLRNPVDLVYSFHHRLLLNRQENVRDFERAWRLQEARRKGEHIPRTNTAPSLLQYRDWGRLGAQAERVLSVFRKEQVRFYRLADLAANPRNVYEDILEFLDVQDDGRQEFPVVNDNRVPALGFLADLTRKPPRVLHEVWQRAKRIVEVENVGVGKLLSRANSVTVPRRPLSPCFRRELEGVFRDDTASLAELTSCDLEA